MRISLLFIFLLLISCNSEPPTNITESAPTQENLTYFEQVFVNSKSLFRGFNIDEKYSGESTATITLSAQDKAEINWKTADDLLIGIEARITIFDSVQDDLLMNEITNHFNLILHQSKSNSNFISWGFNTIQNNPAEVILIREPDRNLICITINHRSHR